MCDASGAAVVEQVDRRRAAVDDRQQLAEKLAVAVLRAAAIRRAEVTSELARAARVKQSAAHSDATVDAPAVDREALVVERALPGKDMRVDGVDERAIEVEGVSMARVGR